MDRTYLLEAIRDLESDLRGRPVRDWLRDQDQETRQHLVAARLEVTVLRSKLETAQLAGALDKLQALEPDLRAGIEDLDDALGRLEDVKRILDGLNKVLGLVARIAAFAL